MGTTIEFECQDRGYAFDYPVPDDALSYYNTTNINKIKVTCTKER